MVFRPLLLDSGALGAIDVHMGAACAAEQGVFAEYHRAAYSNQQAVGTRNGWMRIGEAAPVPDLKEFERCVLSERYREMIVASTNEAHRLGFVTTPASIIGLHPIVGRLTFTVLDSLVKEQLDRLRAGYS